MQQIRAAAVSEDECEIHGVPHGQFKDILGAQATKVCLDCINTAGNEDGLWCKGKALLTKPEEWCLFGEPKSTEEC